MLPLMFLTRLLHIMMVLKMNTEICILFINKTHSPHILVKELKETLEIFFFLTEGDSYYGTERLE